MVPVIAQMVASVLTVRTRPGDVVAAGEVLFVVESMKMEIPVAAPAAGTVRDVSVQAGDVVQEGDTLALIDPYDRR
jgi:acetyl-CoA carboxylase biotin carboxyl carrier protein